MSMTEIVSPLQQTADAWVARPKPNPQARLRLFCFPYAGGGALAYRTWPAYLPPDVEVCAIRLPGRETRLREPRFTRLEPLIDTLLRVLRPSLNQPFAFFGHSLGALISFELARRLRRQEGFSPVHLFVSAHRAPHLPSRHAPVHQASEPVFMARLRGLNGTSEAVFANGDLWQLMQPLLRADFAIWETYRHKSDDPLDCPISAFVGRQDSEVHRYDMEGWHLHTRHAFKLHVFPGDHFYLQTAPLPLLQVLKEDLEPVLCPL